ncbi:MAG: ethanolamine ammonia-lyase reactivating factor EutA [Spirochaetia bacterium]|nr:ethanolamine ammonia-lyase reactivating factor EutA [Spirochaetia bacterium]
MSKILSVGIDIGTTTTQVIFSRITIDNTASYFTVPRISVLDKEIVYQSPVFFTPLKQQVFIDGEKVRDIVAGEFQKAGFKPSQVDTGAVIITGEAARKENSKTVLDTLSDFAGDFVVSTAGPDLESVISGKGSGAYQYSIDNLCTVVNLDIGGGTTNIALFDSGKVTGKSCYDIGGRLIRLDKDGTVQYIAPTAQLIADKVGVDIKVGSRTDEAELSKITDMMADILAQSIGLKEATPLAEATRTKTSSTGTFRQPIERICFSGGVADCIKSTSDDLFAFGDIGILLGRSIRNNPYFAKARRIDASQTIRATVVGAGTYTMNLSGSTIYYSRGIFPIKNTPVYKLPADVEEAMFKGNAEPLIQGLKWFMSQSSSSQVIIAAKGPHNPTFQTLEQAAGCLIKSADAVMGADDALIVISEEDIAKALGIAMNNASDKRRRIASIDSVSVEDGDYLDIGSPLMDGLVVPVIVKTLLFG